MFPEFEDPGVHRRRRWFYGLWAALLGLSLGAFLLWQKPASVEQAKVKLTMVVQPVPAGTRICLWAGTIKTLRGSNPEDLLKSSPDFEFTGYKSLPDVSVHIARRRWLKATIPGQTTEALMVRFTAPGEPPRYYFYDLRNDIETGFLKDRRVLILTTSLAWSRLNPDPKVFSRVR